MNKGLKQEGLSLRIAGSEDCKRNTDLMNKGLKLFFQVLNQNTRDVEKKH